MKRIHYPSLGPRRHGLSVRIGVVALLLAASPALAFDSGPPDEADRAAEAADRAAQDAAKIAERASQDQDRYLADQAKIMEDAAKDPAKAAEDLQKLEQDKAQWDSKIAEDQAKATADAREEEAKIAEDAAEIESGSSGHDSGSDDGSDYGSSAQMQQLGSIETPERDARGFPVRRGEIVALDLGEGGARKAVAEGFRVIERQRLPDLDSAMIRLAVPPGMSGPEAIGRIKSIEPKAAVDYTHYYGLEPAGEAAEAAARGTRMPRRDGQLRIGLIDTDVAAHPALSGAIVHRRDFSHGGGGAPTQHGTAVASILASEGSRTLYVASIFRGAGTPFTSADAVAASLDWMVANRVPVVNISLAGPRNAILDRLVARAVMRGTTIVAAAGNGGPTAPPAYPAALRPVIAVTAVDAGLRVYRYANQGAYIAVAARGVREPAAAAGGQLGLFSGTSFASPHVAAWLARCLGNQRGPQIALCRVKLERSARDLGTPGRDAIYGFGFIQ